LDHARFRIHTPPIIHETVDGETILVNLESGCYYELNDVGTHIFECLRRGSSLTEAAVELTARYEVTSPVAAAAVEDLVGRLTEEQLVESAGDSGAGAPAAPVPAAGHAPGEDPAPGRRRPYVAPVLNKHVDMQELLLLDPVHEVDETGWPANAA
jgi:hypothetical protein